MSPEKLEFKKKKKHKPQCGTLGGRGEQGQKDSQLLPALCEPSNEAEVHKEL